MEVLILPDMGSIGAISVHWQVACSNAVPRTSFDRSCRVPHAWWLAMGRQSGTSYQCLLVKLDNEQTHFQMLPNTMNTMKRWTLNVPNRLEIVEW